ncbi:MAG: hypothetical protein ACE5KH_02230 [Candidatus Geothermarchaeales archaeon]
MRKKLYENKYILSGSPDEMPKKLSQLGKILAKVDVETMELNIVTRGYRRREILAWFTERRLAIIGITVGIIGVILALLFG